MTKGTKKTEEKNVTAEAYRQHQLGVARSTEDA